MNLLGHFRCASAVVMSLVISYTSAAAEFQPKGYIQNDRGDKCQYTQITDPQGTYFFGTATARLGTITFDDPKCMSAADLGLDVNKMMINNVIARWYSHSDAAFQTRLPELFRGSALQQKGLCIQSGTYPMQGITVDYEVQDDSIVRVRHGSSIQGCQN